MLVNSRRASASTAHDRGPRRRSRRDLQLDVNLRGLLIVTREALPLLQEARGHIVNLASIAGTSPTPGLAAYGASKAAVVSLTRSLNRESRPDGVRATALCPAFVDTPMA